jgi:hypothetical protein
MKSPMPLCTGEDGEEASLSGGLEVNTGLRLKIAGDCST